MRKLDIARKTLEILRNGCRISFEVNGEKRVAWLSENGKYIFIMYFGRWACKNTLIDWSNEIGYSKTFDIL